MSFPLNREIGHCGDRHHKSFQAPRAALFYAYR
jgi:hypothetical protein